ncbi:transcriptional regulator AraC family [Vibrio astriarenae]|nr:transcriptional regulator AraC family [Vibrio sp. C7]
MVTVSEFTSIRCRLRARCQPHIGVEVGQRFTLDSLPELEQMINESQDIGEALNKLAVFMNSMNNHVIIWTEYFEGQWWFCHRHGHKPTIPGSTQAEWYRTCQFITFCRVFFGKRWKLRKLKMMGKYNPSITKSTLPILRLSLTTTLALLRLKCRKRVDT